MCRCKCRDRRPVLIIRTLSTLRTLCGDIDWLPKSVFRWLLIWLASSRDTPADGILILKVELIACINIQLFQCLIQQHYTYWSCYEFVRGPNVLWSVLLACILVLAGGFINHVLVTVCVAQCGLSCSSFSIGVPCGFTLATICFLTFSLRKLWWCESRVRCSFIHRCTPEISRGVLLSVLLSFTWFT